MLVFGTYLSFLTVYNRMINSFGPTMRPLLTTYFRCQNMVTLSVFTFNFKDYSRPADTQTLMLYDFVLGDAYNSQAPDHTSILCQCLSHAILNSSELSVCFYNLQVEVQYFTKSL